MSRSLPMDDWESASDSAGSKWRRVMWAPLLGGLCLAAGALLLTDPGLAGSAAPATWSGAGVARPLPTWTALPSAPGASAAGPAAGAAAGPVPLTVQFAGTRCAPGMVLHAAVRRDGKQVGAVTVSSGEEKTVELAPGTYRMEYWTQAGPARSPIQTAEIVVQPTPARIEFPGC